MNTYYSKPQADRLQKRTRLCAWLMLLVALAALVGCIFLSARVNTGNAARQLVRVVSLSTLGGWAVMLLEFFVRRPAKAQHGHIRSVLGGEGGQYTGQLTVGRDGFRIPGSIVVRKATLVTGEETLTFDINAALVRLLPPAGTLVQVDTVRRFITRVEVIGHEEA